MARPSSRDAPRPVGVGVVFATCAALGVGAAGWPTETSRPALRSAEDQADQRAVVTAIEPDTARVGEPVILGVTVRMPGARSVRFPALLPLADPLEQVGSIQQRATAGEGTWRAHYRVVSWQAGDWQIPPFEVESREAAGVRRLEVAPASFYVVSVLPADTAGLELREARPFLRITGPSWVWLPLLALVAAAMLYWLWRRRPAPAAARAPLSPFEQALNSLRCLRRRWTEGRLTAPELYDGLEGALRRYAAATRAWRPGTSLERLTEENRAMASALARSMLVRFARVEPPGDTALASIDAGEAWVIQDAGLRGETEAGEIPAPGEEAA